MLKKLLLISFIVGLLAACDIGSGSPPSRNPPGAVPTQQLTPPGLPPLGFPPLDVPLEGQIVYSNGDGDIYLVEPRPNASSKKLLSAPNNKGYLGEPAWSADGQRITYTYLLPFDASGLPTQELLIARADGSNPQTVLAHQLAGEVFAAPVFSVDDRYLYYSHTKPILKDSQVVSATVKLERLDLQTKQIKELTDDATQPAVSPDGKRIAYIKTDPDTFVQNLWIADVNGEDAKAIVPGNTMGGGLHSPRWTRDSKRILFAAPNLFSSKNQPTNKLTNQPTNVLVSWIVGWFVIPVAEAHGPPWDFWIVDDTGQNMRRVTEIGEDMPYAAFSPDGKKFAFMGLAGLYIVDADGKNVRWLHRDGGHGRLDWKK